MAEKARFAAEAVWAGLPGGRAGFAETSEDLSGDLTGTGMAFLRLAVRGDDQQAVGRAFSGAVVETSLSSYPGTFFTSAPSGAQGVARYWPTTVSAEAVSPHIECDGRPVPATPPRCAPWRRNARGVGGRNHRGGAARPPWWRHGRGPVVGADRCPLGGQGRRCQRRALGGRRCRGGWLHESFSVEVFRTLLPEVGPCEVSRYPLPNLRAVNFVVHGVLGWGVASNLRLDTAGEEVCGELLRLAPSAGAGRTAGERAGGREARRGLHAVRAAGGRASDRMAPWSRSPA